MRKNLLGSAPWIFLLLFLPVLLPAQQTKRYDEPAASFELAMDLLEKEKYMAAREVFGQIIRDIPDASSLIRIQASYHYAQCAYELHHTDATGLFDAFIKTYPEHTLARLAQFQLARLHYRNKEYKEALNAFKRTDIRQLNTEEINEYYFKTGYCFLKGNNLQQAEQAFSKLLNIPSKYQGPANYYYAHIAYEKNEDEKALQGFERLTEDETFGSIVPYYILHIKYRQHHPDEVIILYESSSFSGDDKKDSEIIRMVADAYYQTENYGKAVPLLVRYSQTSAGRMDAADWYQLGYAYFAQGDFQNAIPAFQKSTSSQDSLSQNAYYHLACCYIQTGQKQFAMNAFLSAYKQDHHPAIKEEALFNYAKLAYELSYDPYNEAIKALQQFVDDYPDSERVDEANLYLVNLFMSSNHFEEAITTIENMRQKDEKIKEAYQQVMYNHAIELFNAKDFQQALSLFKKCLDFPYDKYTTAASHYWIAECYYRLGSYESAIDHYKGFLTLPAGYRTYLHYLASYNLGYAYYMKTDYAQAINHFKKFTSGGYTDQAFVMDAYVRIADCYLVTKSYDEAINYYNRVLEKSGADGDYALLQKALAYGGKGDFGTKSGLLKEFLTLYPKSTYTEEVLYELGTTFILLNRDTEAQAYFSRIPKDYPSGKYVKKSLLKIGLIYYNSNNTDLALSTLKKVITDYPGSGESKEALESIRNIYVDLNQVDQFISYSETLPFTDMTRAAQDSLSYFTAENRYMKGDCQGAMEGFSSYIDRFRQGSFLVQAHYYRSECERRTNNLESALEGYIFVISQPASQFTENALERAAAILYEQGEFEIARQHFNQLGQAASTKNTRLTAWTGQMRCSYLIEDFENAILFAGHVIASGNPDEQLEAEAHFITAKSAIATGQTVLAVSSFTRTCELVQDERAAESTFYLARIAFERNDYQEAEKLAFELINQYASFDYWIARGFILLSDIYAATGNLFQAKQTLQSIIDNYPGEDLRNEAAIKLNQIISHEKESQAQPAPQQQEEDGF